ncbi:MAG: hypothetical protein HC805_03540 [Alkalinema sp. RL_2_19]|nr:hypothetical protein [Alkalinema sp. RL_2_19]
MLTLAMAWSDAEIIHLLTVATTDVFWVSESDEPFELLQWPELCRETFDATTLRQQIAVGEETPIAVSELDSFFCGGDRPPRLARGNGTAGDRAIRANHYFIATAFNPIAGISRRRMRSGYLYCRQNASGSLGRLENVIRGNLIAKCADIRPPSALAS